MKFTLKIWWQGDAGSKGGLMDNGGEPVEFGHDCREGICGSCSLQINGEPYDPERLTTTCQLHMRSFRA